MKTILIAEDDKRITTALTVRLEAAGYKVVSKPDGFRSFMAAVDDKPDLILMDISMPLGDGFSVAQELKGVNLEDIPVIFMTASKEEIVKERAREMGAAGFIPKPFDSEQLLVTIARVIRRSRPIPASP